MVDNLAAIRDAVAQGAALAREFMACEAKFYVAGNTTPVMTTPCRVKNPRPSSFDAGNQTEWATKRSMIIQIPVTALAGVVKKGLIVQVTGADDPTVNNVNFVVQSAMGASFAAVRDVACISEVVETPRIV